MLLLNYESKKALKACIGEHLKYTETSLFGPEYTRNGIVYGTNNKRTYFAQIVIKDGLIQRVK